MMTDDVANAQAKERDMAVVRRVLDKYNMVAVNRDRIVDMYASFVVDCDPDRLNPTFYDMRYLVDGQTRGALFEMVDKLLEDEVVEHRCKYDRYLHGVRHTVHLTVIKPKEAKDEAVQ